MKKTNKYGLSRYVPDEIKRAIRKRCGFGCVICGLGFYDYEHFNPDFSEAREHNPDGMTLLCSQCNQKRARKRLSADSVSRANENPQCLQQGFTSEFFDFGINPIYVKFAGVTFFDCKYLIVINDIPMLFVASPKEKNQPILLSGQFTDAYGKTTLSLLENVWTADINIWDIECVGPLITVRKNSRDIALQITLDPPHGLIINHLDMFYQGVHFKGNENNLKISMNGSNWVDFQGCNISHSYAGISFYNAPAAANDGLYEDPT